MLPTRAGLILLSILLPLPVIGGALANTGTYDTGSPTEPVDPRDTDTDTDRPGSDTGAWSGGYGYTAADLAGEEGGSACATAGAAPVGLVPLLMLLWIGRRED